jgi:uncharacterized protein DUF1844
MSDSELTKGAPRDKEGKDGEAEPAFRVIDRRRFAPDGSEKDTAEESPPKPAQDSAPPEPQPRAAANPPPPKAPTEPRQGEGFVMAEEGQPHRSAHDLPEPSFSTLLISLSTQALMHLGEIPDLASGAQEKDLPAAKSIIDILAVLERKTAGNLDAGESSLLERILYDLRMRFVEVARS